MAPVWLWLRTSARTKWRVRASLVLLLVLSGGAALAAVAGARRTDSAFRRLEAATNAPDVLVNPDEGLQAGLDPAAVARLPMVRSAGYGVGMFVSDPSQTSTVSIASADGAYGYTIGRPNVYSGRLPDQHRADEILVNREMAKAHHVRAGSSIELFAVHPAAMQAWDLADGVQDEHGPGDPPMERMRFDVVGIGNDASGIVQDEGFDQQAALLTPAFYRANPDLGGYAGIIARLRRGAADVPAFRTAVEALPHTGVIEFQSESAIRTVTEKATTPYAAALWAFAAAVAVAGLAVVGQAIGRQVFFDSTEFPALRALGFTRGQLLAAALLPAAAVVVVGAVLADVVAWAASPLLPLGPARLIEPHRGFSLDLVVAGAGAAVLAVVMLAVSAIPAVRAVHLRGAAGRRLRPARAPGALAAAGAPVSAVTGVRLAVEPGRGATAAPTRSTMVTAALAVGAVVAAVTVAASLRHFVSTPALYGWNWDATVTAQPDDGSQLPDIRARVEQQLAADRAVAGWSVLSLSRLSLSGPSGRSISVPASGLEAGPGTGAGPAAVHPVIASGRLPAAGEIALGIHTMERLGVTIGDTVRATNGNDAMSLRVAGRVVLPGIGTYTGSDKASPGTGALVTKADLDRIGPQFNHLEYIVRLHTGAGRGAFADRLNRDAPEAVVATGRVERPADVIYYGAVRPVPFLLAALLALMAVAAVAHSLVVTTRRRRRDLALLKVLGFRRRQLTMAVVAQALTTCILAVVVGLPLGVAVGRTAWRLLADGLGVVAGPVIPWTTLAAGSAALLAGAGLLAVLPGRAAGRVRPALALRRD